MKIRFIMLNAFANGGTARTTLDTASRLAAQHDVEVVSVMQPIDTPAYSYDPRVTLRSLVDRRQPTPLDSMSSALAHPADNRYPVFSLATDRRMVREIRSMRDGLLIGTRPAINLMLAQFARPSVHVLAQEHQYLRKWRPELQRSIEKFYPRLDAVTALTPADAAVYREVLPDTVYVTDMPNAVPQVGDERADPSAKLVISSGRLANQKGYDLLIEAFRIVADRHPDWSLHIYGDGPLTKRLRRQIRRSGLTGTVELKGFSRELPARLAGASIFASSSRFEGFPLSLIEAMGIGLSVVSFACSPGPIEIIEDQVSGLLVPPADPAALASGILELIEDPDKRARLASGARERVTRYSAEAVHERWEAMIAQIAARRSGQRRSAVPRPTISIPRRSREVD